MATQYGRLNEFDPKSDSINAYLKRVALYFTANEVDNAKSVPILLSSIGAPTYALLSDLFAQSPQSNKSFAEISEILSSHFEPKHSVIAEHFHFHKREQAVGESIADYDVALRKLTTHCQFGATLEEALRDRFVCGLRYDTIQRRLLSETTLNYNKALDIAKGMEAADQNTKAFRIPEPIIKALSDRPPKPSDSPRCYRCGHTNHRPADCKFRDMQCHSCGKTGHIAPVCRSKPRPKKKQDQAHRRDTGKTHRIQDDDQLSDHEDSSDNEYLLHKLGERSSDPIEVQMLLNGKKLNMEVDTGTALSIISEATRKCMFADETLHPSSLVLKTYTDERMEVMGTLNMRVQYGEQKKLILVVVGGNGMRLLGRNCLKHIKLDWSSIVAMRTIKM